MEITNQHEKSCPFTGATGACKCSGPACALWNVDHGCAIRSTAANVENVVPALLEISDKLDRILDAVDD